MIRQKINTYPVSLRELLGIFRKPNPFWSNRWANLIFAGIFYMLLLSVLGPLLALLLTFSLVVHELGHAWALMRYGIGVRSFGFLPIGAVIQNARTIDYRYQEGMMALMGPLWGSAVIVFAFPIMWMTGSGLVAQWIAYTAIINLFNLLPIVPLDGGRVVNSIFFTLSPTIGRIFRYFGFAAAVGITLFGAYQAIYFGSPTLLMVGAFITWIGFREMNSGFNLWMIPMKKWQALAVLAAYLILFAALLSVVIIAYL